MAIPDQDPPVETVPADGHAADGPYIIAPDSAKPWPDEIWRRINLVDLEHTVETINGPAAKADAAELKEFTSQNGIFIPGSDLDLLRRIGGSAATKALHRLNES